MAVMIERNADGTVNHNGEYNPWEHIDVGLADRCRANGGFAMRTGFVMLGRTTVEVKDGVFTAKTEPSRHYGDGLMYVSFTPPTADKP